MTHCPRCGASLVPAEEAPAGITPAMHCDECLWTPDIATTPHCPHGPMGKHVFSMADSTQCEYCLKFKEDAEDEEWHVKYEGNH